MITETIATLMEAGFRAEPRNFRRLEPYEQIVVGDVYVDAAGSPKYVDGPIHGPYTPAGAAARTGARGGTFHRPYPNKIGDWMPRGRLSLGGLATGDHFHFDNGHSQPVYRVVGNTDSPLVSVLNLADGAVTRVPYSRWVWQMELRVG